ncbi:MAG: hypothetical protein ACRC14_06205 [Paracoccaceae bacterium]
MRRLTNRVKALFDPDRHGPRLAGFVLGATAAMVTMSLVHVAFNGGLSDTPGTPAQAYIIQ